MPALKIRGDYDLLTQMSQIFSRHSAETQGMINRLNQNVSTLQGGDWIGKGANAFYREMENEVFPSLKRLAAALNIAGRTTRQINQILQEAEDEAARIFRIVGPGGLAASLGIAQDAAGDQASSQAAVSSLASDPGSLFSTASLQILIGSQFQGAGLQLGILMNGFMQNPSGDGLDEFIQALADIRDRGVGEIQVEIEIFQELQEQRDAAAPETETSPGGGGGAPNSFMGSMTQMRYGSVVGDAFGIDPVFGAMLNPTGGLIGPGNFAVAGGDSAVGYHAVAHAAAGYLYNSHQVGPGYDYLGQEGGDPSSPLTGNRSGIAFWRNAVGGSSSSSTSSNWTRHSAAGGTNLKSALFGQTKGIY
jgi:WXG100 family type VII secretion target